MNELLCSDSCVWLHKSDFASLTDKARVKKALTVVPKKHNKEKDEDGNEIDPTPILCYVEDGDFLGVPIDFGLAWAKKKNRSVTFDKTLADFDEVTFPVTPKPRADIFGQKQFFEEVTAHLQGANTTLLAEAPTGTGKTICACYAAAKLGVTMFVVVPNFDIAAQWVEALTKICGFAEEDIGMIGDGKRIWKDKPVTIGIINTVADGELAGDLTDYFGFVVFDEAHRLGAATFSKALRRFNAAKYLLLSATPYRSDECEAVFTSFAGEVGVRAEGTAMPLNIFKINYRRKFWGRNKDPNKLPYAILTKILSMDDDRNELLALSIYRMYEKGRNVIGGSTHIAQLCKIREKLIKLGVPPSEVGIYAGHTVDHNDKEQAISRSELSRVRTQCRIILGTYQKVKEAFDVPRLDGCIDLIPIADATQFAGRTRRRIPKKLTPVFMTVLDEGIGLLQGFYNKRTRLLIETNARIL